MNHFILKSQHPSSCHCTYHATGIYIVHKLLYLDSLSSGTCHLKSWNCKSFKQSHHDSYIQYAKTLDGNKVNVLALLHFQFSFFFFEWTNQVTKFKVYLLVQFYLWFKFFITLSLLLVSNSLSFISILRNKRENIIYIKNIIIWTTIFMHYLLLFLGGGALGHPKVYINLVRLFIVTNNINSFGNPLRILNRLSEIIGLTHLRDRWS